MTLNEHIALFRRISVAHLQLHDFGFGNQFEINGDNNMNYPVLWVVPIDSVITEQTIQRRFLFIVAGLVKHDLSNRDEVWSDTEQIMGDIIKIFRNEDGSYELIGDPVIFPVSEKHADWVTGHQAELVIQSQFKSNYCDIPMEDL